MENLDQLNRQSKIPLYHQLYKLLRGTIIRGEWGPGTMIPAESELCRTFQVSQITARQALENLVNDGLIYRQRGRGSFVAQPAIETSLTRIISFTEDMHQRGFTPGSQVIFSGLVESNQNLAERLQIAPGEILAQLHRLRFADGEPLSIEKASLVHRYCPGVLNNNFEDSSLRETLRTQFDIQLVRAKQSIRALNAIRDQATLLGITPNGALLVIDRVSYSQDDMPIEHLQIFYHADRYIMYTDLQG
ncbi:MAG TPA: GntR family transcriptional regulator [Patescibacteria group bacterium]|jgi:GntR family transcriptional regulator|nr:GntR family transcriptional regulator [Patescibacteria group bacterium]